MFRAYQIYDIYRTAFIADNRENIRIFIAYIDAIRELFSMQPTIKELLERTKQESFKYLFISLSLFTIVTFSFINSEIHFVKISSLTFFNKDWLTFWLLLLTTIIFALSFLWVIYIKQINKGTRLLSLLILEITLLIVFSSNNLLIFFIGFELSLAPMYVLVCEDGSRARKLRANYYLAFYTLISGVFLLVALINYFIEANSLNFHQVWVLSLSDPERQNLIWVCFFLSFIGKIPSFPFHIWLPEAHVEASTVGSVILAAIMLKLGLYGIIRFNLNMGASLIFFQPLVISLALLSIFYSSIVSLRQLDMKRIVAYSSIIHMNMALLGLISETTQGLLGGIMLIFSHGLVSALLFFIIGALYDRVHTKIIFYYSGLTMLMPLFASFFLLGSFANIGFPLTFNFISELLVFIGVFNYSTVLGILIILSTIISSITSIWLLNRVVFGSLKLKYYKIKGFNLVDLSYREFYVMCVLMILTIFLGLYPESFIFFQTYK